MHTERKIVIIVRDNKNDKQKWEFGQDITINIWSKDTTTADICFEIDRHRCTKNDYLVIIAPKDAQITKYNLYTVRKERFKFMTKIKARRILKYHFFDGDNKYRKSF